MPSRGFQPIAAASATGRCQGRCSLLKDDGAAARRIPDRETPLSVYKVVGGRKQW